MGCHFLLQCMEVKSEREVAQSCPTLSDPMDCSLPGSSVHGIFQARVLEWGAIALLTNPPSYGSHLLPLLILCHLCYLGASFFFLIILFILFGCAILFAATQAPLQLWRTGFSLRWPLLLWSTGSRVQGLQWLQHMGSIAAAPGSRA